MGGTLLRLRAWWETADRTTKTVTLVGGGLLAALLIGVSYLAGSPDMRQLFPPLEATEQGRVIQKLQELKIPYKHEADGSILVPSHRIPETRARLAQDGIPAAGALGNLRLDSMGFTDPAALQDKKMRVALEEELQKTIEFMAPVAAAKVHISPGDDSPFVNASSQPSGSVVVQLRPSAGSSREVAEAIVRTMTGAVQGLQPEKISVSDSNGVVLWDGETPQGSSTVAGKKRQAELAESDRLVSTIERMITQAVGPGKAVVSADVEMNFDKEDLVTNTEKPTPEPVSSEVVTERYGPGVGRPTAGGATGLQPPAPAEPGAARGASGYELSQRTENRGTINERSERVVAPGKLVAARVSIMLDESAAAHQQQIFDFAGNLIGADQDPEHYSVKVTAVPFDTTAAEAARRELAAAKSGRVTQQLFSLLPLAALLIIGFMVIKAIGKAAANNANVVLTAGALPAGAYRHAAPEPARPPAVLPPAPSEPEMGGAARRRAEMIRRSMVEEIPEKFDMNLEQILKMADTRPESVALLIKSWLLEETA